MPTKNVPEFQPNTYFHPLVFLDPNLGRCGATGKRQSEGHAGSSQLRSCRFVIFPPPPLFSNPYPIQPSSPDRPRYSPSLPSNRPAEPREWARDEHRHGALLRSWEGGRVIASDDKDICFLDRFFCLHFVIKWFRTRIYSDPIMIAPLYLNSKLHK